MVLDGNPRTSRSTSFIETHEEDEAQAFVSKRMEEACGVDRLPRPCGYLLAVMLHISPSELSTIDTPDGPKTLWMPDISRDKEKYTSLSGLVVGVGNEAYKGSLADGTPRFAEPWCRVGDFILFPRHEAALFGWKPKGAHTAIPMISLADDKVQMVIESPTDVEPINVRDRV